MELKKLSTQYNELHKMYSEAKKYRNEYKHQLSVIMKKFYLFYCPICKEPTKMDDIFYMKNCGDYFCRKCTAKFVNNCLTNKKELPSCPLCMKSHITNIMSAMEIESVINNPNTIKQYHDLNLMKALSQNENNSTQLFQCRCKFTCEIPINLIRFDCHRCGNSLCVKCHQLFHYKQSCKQYSMHIKFNKSPKNTINCPTCKKIIQTTHGCNKVGCNSCQIFICLKCNEILSLQHWKTHYNPPYICALFEPSNDLYGINVDNIL